jgi:hypothetical protein
MHGCSHAGSAAQSVGVANVPPRSADPQIGGEARRTHSQTLRLQPCFQQCDLPNF